MRVLNTPHMSEKGFQICPGWKGFGMDHLSGLFAMHRVEGIDLSGPALKISRFERTVGMPSGRSSWWASIGFPPVIKALVAVLFLKHEVENPLTDWLTLALYRCFFLRKGLWPNLAATSCRLCFSNPLSKQKLIDASSHQVLN